MRILIVILSVFIGSNSFAGWVQKADFGGIARHRTPMLSIAGKIYTGMGHYNGAGPNIIYGDWWEYDPSDDSWTQKADYLGGETYHSAGFTIGNIGYIGTGRKDIPVVNTLVKTFFSYNPATNAWTQLQNFPGSGRRGGVGFELNGYGYIGTGSGTSDFYRYNPTSDSWNQVAFYPGAGTISAASFTLNGKAYVGTGGPSNDFWEYDPTSGQWTQKANVGPITRTEATGFSVNGRGYIGTGDNWSSGTNYKDMYEYNAATNTWTQIEDFPGLARRYMACATIGNYAYGGLGTSGTNYKDFWQFNQTLSLLERGEINFNMTAYPNPTSDFINVTVGGLKDYGIEKLNYEIISSTGQLVSDGELTEDNGEINLLSLEAGMYFISVNYEGKRLDMKQIIKE